MNELQIFNNEEFGEVRTVTIENEPWFVGKDVAAALGYTDTNHSILDHVDEEDRVNSKTQGRNDPEFGQRGTWLINESGVYSLVFGSKLESAKRFKHWVTSEVLPSIRKHGMYATDATIDRILEDPDFGIKLLSELKAERQKNRELESSVQDMNHVIEEMKPKVNYVDLILENKSTVLTTQIAQDYGLSAKAFNKKLKEFRIQRKVGKQWILYADYQGKGYVHSKTYEFEHKNGQKDVNMNTEWTQKGRLFLYEELKKHDVYPMIEQAE